jgi:hypothetical protein|tara:strand:- start:1343 stop:1696 length:354 start_codon:yes stop_codon:yes gene_type:complete
MSERAKLVKQLNKKGIQVPKGAKVADLKHRLEYWLSPNGWLVRLAKPASRKPNNPISLITSKDTVWIPDSRMAKEIIETKLVFVLGRTPIAPKGVEVIDVPKDFNDKWPVNQLGEEE